MNQVVLVGRYVPGDAPEVFALDTRIPRGGPVQIRAAMPADLAEKLAGYLPAGRKIAAQGHLRGGGTVFVEQVQLLQRGGVDE